MDEFLLDTVRTLPNVWLAVWIIVSLMLLGKGADWLVDESVELSLRWRVPKAIIGATVVSLGTTLPEMSVSVIAALSGSPGLALGNAVGSIICDTGLILGLAVLIGPIPLDKRVLNRQGWIQFFAACLLVAFSLPLFNLGDIFILGGVLPRWVGFLFLGLLVTYLVQSIRWSRSSSAEEESKESQAGGNAWALPKLLFSIALVVACSKLLIPAASEAALRMNVSEGIIAATIVAFGTSLPELVTAVTSSLRGHGELGLGNVVGADILNVLFVAGAATASTSGGLAVSKDFFILYYPAMLFVIVVFRLGIAFSKTHLRREMGWVLLGSYLLVTLLGYLLPT